MAYPPPVIPIIISSSCSPSPFTWNVGSCTPATLSIVMLTLTFVLFFTESLTVTPKSPAAKFAYAISSWHSLKSFPMFFFVSTILLIISLNAFFKASDFFFSKS